MKELSQKLEHAYGFTIQEMKLVQSSGDNDTYKIVTDEGVFFGRLSKRKNKDSSEIDLELGFLKYLKESHLPVAGVILTKSGENFASIEDRPLVIFEWIDGSKFMVSPGKYLSREKVYDAGRVLATLHNVSATYTGECTFNRTLTTELERIIDIQDDISKKYSNGNKFVGIVTRMIECARERSLQKHVVIHNDFRPQNVLFGSSEKNKDAIVGIVDFDWMCLAPPAKDLALALVEWSFADGESVADFGSLESFLKGYVEGIDEGYRPSASDLSRWIEYACLSDTATYIADSVSEEKERGAFDTSQTKELKSYMFSKARYFKSVDLEAVFKKIL